MWSVGIKPLVTTIAASPVRAARYSGVLLLSDGLERAGTVRRTPQSNP